MLKRWDFLKTGFYEGINVVSMEEMWLGEISNGVLGWVVTLKHRWRKPPFYYSAVLAGVVAFALVVFACSSDQQPTTEATPTFQPPPDIQEPTSAPTPTPSDQETPVPSGLSDNDQKALMYRLLIDVNDTQDVSEANSAVSEILTLRDQSLRSFYPCLLHQFTADLTRRWCFQLYAN